MRFPRALAASFATCLGTANPSARTTPRRLIRQVAPRSPEQKVLGPRGHAQSDWAGPRRVERAGAGHRHGCTLDLSEVGRKGRETHAA